MKQTSENESIVEKGKHLVEDLLWRIEPRSEPPAKRLLVMTVRCIHALYRDIAAGQLQLHGMGLVYTTLLSIVPLLALSFSVLKALGAHKQVEPFLFDFLKPLGPSGAEIGNTVISFVENMKVGVLGSVGLAFLVYTVISLVQKIERSFNFIWHTTDLRNFGERFSNYLSVILIGPVLIVSALGLMASVSSSDAMNSLLQIGFMGAVLAFISKLMPFLLIVILFTFVYVFVPNTKVEVGPALVGGLIAGLLWKFTGGLFTEFVVGSTKYTAIYSSFAIMILLLMWLYVNWLILLLGADVSFYVQHPEYMKEKRTSINLSPSSLQIIGFKIMYLSAKEFHIGGKGVEKNTLTRELDIPELVIQYVIDILERHNLLIAIEDGQKIKWVPARSIEKISAYDIYQVLNTSEVSLHMRSKQFNLPLSLADLLREKDKGVATILKDKTLKDLIEAPEVLEMRQSQSL